jgi:DnaK suppressor protein
MSKENKGGEYHLLREMLLRKRAELSQHIEERRAEIVMDLEPEDEVGVALRNASTGMAIINMEREMRTLAEIDLSLHRMELGEYGVCRVCAEKIPLARLKAIPWTRCCIDCVGGHVARSHKAQNALDDQPDLSMTRR